MAQPKTSFSNFISSLNQLDSIIRGEDSRSLILIHGSNNFLVFLATSRVKERLRMTEGISVSSYNAHSINLDTLRNIFFQSSIFDPRCFNLIDNAEKLPDFPKTLAEIGSLSKKFEIKNLVCFVSDKGSLKESARKEFAKIGFIEILCTDLAPYEIPDFVDFYAASVRLKFSKDATTLLIDLLGRDLALLANEIKKISLIFPDRTEPIRSTDLADHLGVLKEDFAGRLRTLLTEKQFSKAQVLLTGLLQRGESPLGVLGLLSKHCRNALKIIDAERKGKSIQEICSETGLQNYVVTSYRKNFSHSDFDTFARALDRAFKADIILKTSPQNEEMVLSAIIQDLSKGCR